MSGGKIALIVVLVILIVVFLGVLAYVASSDSQPTQPTQPTQPEEPQNQNQDKPIVYWDDNVPLPEEPKEPSKPDPNKLNDDDLVGLLYESLPSGKNSGMCLDLDHGKTVNGTNIKVAACKNLAAQKFALGKTGLLHVKNNPTKCVHIAGETKAGANVNLWPCSKTNPRFKWTVNNGKYKADGLCLDWNTDSNNAEVWPCHGNPNQIWGAKYIVTPETIKKEDSDDFRQDAADAAIHGSSKCSCHDSHTSYSGGWGSHKAGCYKPDRVGRPAAIRRDICSGTSSCSNRCYCHANLSQWSDGWTYGIGGRKSNPPGCYRPSAVGDKRAVMRQDPCC